MGMIFEHLMKGIFSNTLVIVYAHIQRKTDSSFRNSKSTHFCMWGSVLLWLFFFFFFFFLFVVEFVLH